MDAGHGDANDGCGSFGIMLQVADQVLVATHPREHPPDNPPTLNPVASDRVAIYTVQTPVCQTVKAILGPAYPPSAKCVTVARQAQQGDISITVLDIGWMNDDVSTRSPACRPDKARHRKSIAHDESQTSGTSGSALGDRSYKLLKSDFE